MFDKNITPAEYLALSTARADMVRQLLVEALQEHVPAGYVLSVDPAKMYGNALLALRPLHPVEGHKMVSFMHAINYRPSVKGGELSYRPTVEFVRAYGDAKGTAHWESDVLFGAEGRLEITSGAGVNLAAMISFIAAQVCSFAPFTAFEWRRCQRDDGGKWELFNGERHMQSVWKSGSRYGTLMGTCPATLAAAKAEAETAARFTICCEHQERLASLGEQFAQVEVSTEGEEAEVPSM